MAVISCGDGSLADPLKIQIGQTRSMLVKPYAITLKGAYHSPVSYSLDIDNNGVVDIQFTSNIWGSPGIGQHPEADISSLNNLTFIYAKIISDTAFLFIKNDTNYFGKVNIILNKTYSCQRISSTDSILSNRDSKYINVLRSFDYIRTSGPWLSGKVNLNNDDYAPPVERVFNSIDTCIFKQDTYNYDCHSFPNDQIAYIGIKLIDEAEVKLAWIKLSIKDKYIISVLETAIQK